MKSSTFKHIKITSTLVMLVLAILLLSNRYQLSFVPSAVGCLPIKAAVIDSSNRSPERGQLMSFLSGSAEPYFANGTNFLKIAAGVAGDKVKVDAYGVTITSPSGKENRYITDAHRMLSYAQMTESDITTEFVVPVGHYFALGTLPTSFDSRYWGLVDSSQVIGVGYAFL